MENVYLTTEKSIFLIEFKGNHNKIVFSNTSGTLGNLIQEFNRYGIEKLLIFNPVKLSFKKMTKKEIELHFNWCTHSIEELKKTNFIK